MIDPVKYFEQLFAKQQEYLAAIDKQVMREAGHLEAMLVKEQEMAEEDGIPMSEEETAAIMSKHKASSPFAMDVAVAKQALIEAVQK